MRFLQLPDPEFTGEQARDAADRVLSGRAYTEADRPPSLQERAFDWLADRIGDLFNALSTTGGRGVIAWVVIAFFAAVIVFFLSRLLRNVDPLPSRAARPQATIGVVEGRTRSQWLEEADAAARSGDFRAAIRCRHRALVAALVDGRLLSARPGFTAGEIASSVASSRPAAQAAMDQLTAVFDDTWYGYRPALAEDYERFTDLADLVESEVARQSQPEEPGEASQLVTTPSPEPAPASSGTP